MLLDLPPPRKAIPVERGCVYNGRRTQPHPVRSLPSWNDVGVASEQKPRDEERDTCCQGDLRTRRREAATAVQLRRARERRPVGVDFGFPGDQQPSELGEHRRVGGREVSALTDITLEVEQELITATSPRPCITQVLPSAASNCTLEASGGLCAPEQRPLDSPASGEERNQVNSFRPIRGRR